MAPSRAYVPSRALIRALSRPQPTRCPLARPLPAHFVRGKRSKAAKGEKPQPNAAVEPDPSLLDRLKGSRSIFDNGDKMDKAMRPLSDAELERDDLPVINWYEQDLDKGTPQRLIERIATPEDRKKDKEMYTMIEESHKNPDYDDAKLNRRLIDSLLSNPNFAELTEELRDIKQSIKSREELQALEEEEAAEAEAGSKEFNAGLRMATHEALQELIDDPDIGDAKADLQEVIDKMPEMEDIDSPEFQEVLQKAMAKLEGNEAMQKKIAALEDGANDAELEEEWEQYQKNTDDAITEAEAPDDDLAVATPEDMQDVDKLLHQMRDVMKSLGGDSTLEAELDAALSEDPTGTQDQEGVFEREMDPEELAEELKKLAQSKASQPPQIEEEEEEVPAELQAKVDKIMEDPKLMEKLMYIQKLISENKQQPADLTTVAHETAPDPYELEDSRTATLKERMAIARRDPEHSAALQRLRVRLPPPFNISPALKSFNQAIEFAYIGANDDIRRILWRSYQKARALPTFLQNLGDEAWDILYYSQAVTWGSNQNRQDHLRILLADLQSLGRDGPPTHPTSLINGGAE
ncbi:2-oxoglutarate-dependent ethylene succinate-forming enzyme [Stemphylium lycopersici]|uniref:2-oxoglutarate-dependent ethylene succinate-forming enzyme n=1 Tax=Stemphylium lycopersici TaxID=183478 RepID=A0A364N3S5_STELY|nr:2-oxoglutarate-dependent ethylene succinate-forming enzyme [Stemphylium lycopersici]RAR05961.1 2-oxoglutarate-dependent ethylene succinate-forming enzyme [Stemphylium lycopersici]RAR11075.1 2-oxoglutarate-dependent ethylene succinate-forming enzyme [Stemphylium lycopersici]